MLVVITDNLISNTTSQLINQLNGVRLYMTLLHSMPRPVSVPDSLPEDVVLRLCLGT